MNIFIVGGDSRIAYLARMLAKDENVIYAYGLEKCELLKDCKHVESIEEGLQNSDLLITSIPLSKDGKLINTVYSEKQIAIESVFKKVQNAKVITGNITEEIAKIINHESSNTEIIDVMKLEQLTILNAIPTAEGAIQIAMEKSLITLHNSKCLILGFGRIGKILAKMLLGIGAQVYCEARKSQDIAWIESYGYNAIHLENLNNYLSEFDFIFNTVPHVILDKGNLNLIKKECLLIDLASKPGGIDFEEASRLKLQNEWALALPGKVAPKTAAKYLYEVIKQEINKKI